MNRKKNVVKTFISKGDEAAYKIQEHPAIAKYSERINDKIRAEYGVIESLINHQPSIGNYYEKILLENIKSSAPSSVKFGSGFIIDKNSFEASPQIDILIYSDRDKAPLFRLGDLVVVTPEQVKAVIEVKKCITLSDVDDIVNKFIFSNTGFIDQSNSGYQVLNIFTYEKKAKINRYFERIKEKLTEKLEKKYSRDGQSLTCCKTITLPRLYFLNDNQFIECKLIKKGLVHEVDISINEILYATGGASDLIYKLFHSDHRLESEEFSLFSVGLYGIGQSTKLDVPVILRRYISFAEMMLLFPEDERLKFKPVTSESTGGFYVPYDWNNTSIEKLNNDLKSGVVAFIIDKDIG